MRWELEWGKHEGFLSGLKESGIEPQALKGKPELDGTAHEMLTHFYVLNRSRNIGVGVGPIPITEMEAWIRLNEIDDIEMFLRVMIALDDAYLEAMNND